MRDSAYILGSATAKAGFQTEKDIVELLNQKPLAKHARELLRHLDPNLADERNVCANTVARSKADIEIKVESNRGSLSHFPCQVKLVSNDRGYNQIDKRWTEDYRQLWDMPLPVADALKLYSGDIKHGAQGMRDERRLFADELDINQQNLILEFLSKNKMKIAQTVFKGTESPYAEWLIVVLAIAKQSNLNGTFVYPMDEVISFYFDEDPTITPKGNFKIGKVTLQRKGGDRGRPTANMLQFKIDPARIVRDQSERQ